MSSIRSNIAAVITISALSLCAFTAGQGSAHAENAIKGVNWDAIAECESGGNWAADTGNGFYGGLQFKMETWSSHGGDGSPARASREEQIKIAENVAETQGLGAWPTCGSKAGVPLSAGKPSPKHPSAGQPDVATVIKEISRWLIGHHS